MASHVFSQTARYKPRRGHLALFGLGATIGDNQSVDQMPDASRASIVGPDGVPPSDSMPVDVATDIPSAQQPTGSDVTPAQIAAANIVSTSPSSTGYSIDPVTGQPVAIVKHDLWYMAGQIWPWAVGGTLALALGTFLYRRMRRGRR
jgi:hypothetical protein